MLDWKDDGQTVVANLNGYMYTITQGEAEEAGQWGVLIADPEGGVVTEVCSTLEEAKEFCERTAAEVQAEE